jgi:GMP synthase (glutamine-hydrolysing)
MILVVNCFYEEAFAADFDQAVAGHFQAAGNPSNHVHATRLGAAGDLDAHTHLVISGSVASATEVQPWDQPLGDLVRRFVAAGKPVLGICYGHQFLAKVLAGPRHVRRAAACEFGWLELDLAPNPLFRDLERPLLMASHYDEACDLPADFKVLAASADCPVHAFQNRDLPVWGVQFHPEYGAAEGDRIWKEVFCRTPGRIPRPPADLPRLAQNRLIFRNFAEVRAAGN